MTDAIIEAVIFVMVAFSGMRMLYGSWPWEGRKTWYATRRLSQSGEHDGEGISLTAEQISHALASIASIANGMPGSTKNTDITGINSNPALVIDSTKSSEIGGANGNRLVIEIPACNPTVKPPDPLHEAVVSIQSFIQETADKRKIDARRLQPSDGGPHISALGH